MGTNASQEILQTQNREFLRNTPSTAISFLLLPKPQKPNPTTESPQGGSQGLHPQIPQPELGQSIKIQAARDENPIKHVPKKPRSGALDGARLRNCVFAGSARRLELRIRLFCRGVLLSPGSHRSDSAFWLTRILKPWPMVNQARLLYIIFGPVSSRDGERRPRGGKGGAWGGDFLAGNPPKM